MADFNLGRLRFVWKGEWVASTTYVRDDVVQHGGSSYVALNGHVAGSSFSTDLADNKWSLMAEKGADGDPGTPTTTAGDLIYRGLSGDTRLPIGTAGQALMVGLDGIPEWTGLVEAHNVYYVSVDGDDANDGKNLNKAFATIRHACSIVQGPAVIHVKTGTYKEILPIKVPAGVTIQGDGQRVSRVEPLVTTAPGADVQGSGVGNTTTTNIVINHDTLVGGQFKVGAVVTGPSITGTKTVTQVQENVPSAGFDTITISHTQQIVADQTVDLVSDYSRSVMWQLGDATMLNKLFFVGMSGFEPDLDHPEDITAAGVTLGGVFVAFDPDSPILTKSPYVLECAAFGANGGVGAVVDGAVHSNGLKSMVFHGYTIVNDNGVGYWVNGQGKAEIVSCFTYYCWFGYTTTNGGKIRALNGNNSYGKYGVVSRGFDSTESTLTGTLYGNCLTYDPLTMNDTFLANTTITGGTSGATGTIINVQASVNRLYYHITSGTFQGGEVITASNGASATLESDGVTGQKGYVLVITGLAEEPKIGGSIEFATGYGGDTNTYVIQSFTGTYVNSNSKLVVVLAQEKEQESPGGESFNIRYKFSQCRLTGHDFLSIGTGGRTTTNYPGIPLQASSQGNEVIEAFPGRVYYVSTDQDGNFRVGDYFRVDQATGRATLNASAFDLAGLTSLKLGSIGAQLGETVNEFSADDTLSGDSTTAVPVEYAVRHYFEKIDTNVVIRDPWILFRGTNAQSIADLDGLSGLISFFQFDSNEFAQFAVKNSNNGSSASTDIIAYSSNGSNDSGWIDMGITSENFADATYGVTGPNDGYIFMSAPENTTGHGNLYLSTSDFGTQNDIVFSTNGFVAGTERARIIGVAHDGYDPGLILHGEIQAFGAAIYQGEKQDGTTAKDLTVDGANYVGLTNASGVFTGDADSFVQFALKNHNGGSHASTDLIAYASNGDNDSGWIDMGITSETFSDATYGVTGPDDGYIFMSAPVGTTGHGNLFLSTSENGTHNDIVFSTDGFTAGSERMRIVGTDRPGTAAGVIINIATQSTSSTTGALRVTGGIGLQGNLNVGGDVNITGSITLGGSGDTVQTNSLSVSDPIIRMGNGNTTDVIDLGFVGIYGSGGTKYTGLVRDASDGVYKLFVNNANNPTNTVDFTGATYGSLKVGALDLHGSTGLTTTQSTVSIVNATATTVNFAGAATEINVGGISGALTINNPTVVGTQATQNLWNTTATTVNFAGAATTISIGNASGTTTINGGLSVTGLTTLQETTEVVTSVASPGASTSQAFTQGTIYYMSSMAGNFTFNLTSVPTTASRTIICTLILAQGATPYYCNTFQIDGVGQVIKWPGGVSPTVVANRVELQTFTLIRTPAGAWTVLSQISSYA